MENTDLSIIIVNYNTKELLLDCLHSLFLAERKGFTIEIFIVDNGSTDGSVEQVKKEIAKNKKNWPKLEIVENKRNLGFARANNLGIKKSLGRYILFLNPDTVVEKKTLSYMVKFMDKHKEVGAATCRVELKNGQLDQACHRGFPTPWNSFCYFSGLEKIFRRNPVFSGYSLSYLPLDAVHEIDSGCGAFLIVRREAGGAVGWWDEDYFWYGEDLDVCYRIKQKGWKIMFVPHVKIIHYKGAASGIKSQTQKFSTASLVTKIRSARASANVMRIFYRKHYRKKYPLFIWWLVWLATKILEFSRIIKIYYHHFGGRWLGNRFLKTITGARSGNLK